MSQITYSVPNISCAHCVHTIQSELSEVKGVIRVEADAETKLVTVEYAPPATPQILEDLLQEINYPVQK